MFSLSKFGKTVDTMLAQEGATAAMKYENGDEGLEFRMVKAFNGSTGGRVEMEDVIWASAELIDPSVSDLSVLPAYYQGENMTVNFSIMNPGTIEYNATPLVTINSEGGSAQIKPELSLGANQSKNFSVFLKAAKDPGAHKVTITMKLDEYTTVTKTKDYQGRLPSARLILMI
ncbi:MAG: hypothetical protein KKG76_08095 [Euryarchaeota archaeon]|nr:hypothetical protein [Euryarchaeota archaeon]